MTKSSDEAKSHDKPCTLCGVPRPVLVRCQIDETGQWHFVCPGKCWQSVSGGVEDAKGLKEQFPHYRYGGMWKNKHVDGPLSAKKPKKVKDKQKRQEAKRQQQRESATVGAKSSEDESISDEDTKGGKVDGVSGES